MNDAYFLQHSPVTVIRRIISLAIVCLIVVGSMWLGSNARDVFAVPAYWVLAGISCVLVIPFRKSVIVTIQRIVAAYFIVLGVDYLSGVYWPLMLNLQIAAWLPVAAATVLATWIAPRQKSGGDGLNELTTAMGSAVIVIAAILLVTGFLVYVRYGFGAEQNVAVLGKIGMTLIAGIAAWRLSNDKATRVAIGVMGAAAYSCVAVV